MLFNSWTMRRRQGSDVKLSFSSSARAYCRSGNIREFQLSRISRDGQIRENYYPNSATKEKRKFANSKLREKFQNQKFAKI